VLLEFPLVLCSPCAACYSRTSGHIKSPFDFAMQIIQRNGFSTSALAYLLTRKQTMDQLQTAEGKTRKLVFIVGGMTVLGMRALIALVLISSFPGPPQGSPDKPTLRQRM
jgi:hypothetical protein